MEMVQNKFGNMAQVYHHLHSNADREEFIRQADEKRGPFEAEIVGGCDPLWHVVTTIPNNDKIAAAHLIARRFGVYLPEFSKKMPAIGARSAHFVRRPLLPGYLFLFVWDIRRHMRRIEACTGVHGVLFEGQYPFIVPDDFIDYMQGKEFSESGLMPPKKRKSRKNARKAYDSGPDDGTVRISPYSALERIEDLEDEGRISAFHRALGLETKHGLVV